MDPWPRHERLRVLSVLGPDLPPRAWAERMGVSARQILADLRCLDQGDRVQVLAEIMHLTGLTHEQVAVVVGRGASVVSEWLRGRESIPSQVLHALARRVGMRIRVRYELEVMS